MIPIPPLNGKGIHRLTKQQEIEWCEIARQRMAEIDQEKDHSEGVFDESQHPVQSISCSLPTRVLDELLVPKMSEDWMIDSAHKEMKRNHYFNRAGRGGSL